jgi:hypothetical protein
LEYPWSTPRVPVEFRGSGSGRWCVDSMLSRATALLGRPDVLGVSSAVNRATAVCAHSPVHRRRKTGRSRLQRASRRPRDAPRQQLRSPWWAAARMGAWISGLGSGSWLMPFVVNPHRRFGSLRRVQLLPLTVATETSATHTHRHVHALERRVDRRDLHDACRALARGAARTLRCNLRRRPVAATL